MIFRRNTQPGAAASSIKSVVESKGFEWFITALILINAVTMGMETDKGLQQEIGPLLHGLDLVILVIFTIEIALRLFVYNKNFFKDAWSLFDFTIIVIAWIPASGPLSVLRALRVLRVLRLVSVIPSLRKVVNGLIAALPGMGSIVMLLMLVFYVFSVMGTSLFSEDFPQWFGSLGKTAYTLFQIMTLESWSMGIVRPIMEVHPYSWVYFVFFIVSTSFTVLNLFIGIIVSAMTAETEAAADEERRRLQADQETILQELRKLRMDVSKLNQN